jgi:excisionase family DNA binding protein
MPGIEETYMSVGAVSAASIEPIVYDVPTAAQALRVSVHLIRKLVYNGALPAARVGDRVLIRRQDLDAFLASRVRSVEAS